MMSTIWPEHIVRKTGKNEGPPILTLWFHRMVEPVLAAVMNAYVLKRVKKLVPAPADAVAQGRANSALEIMKMYWHTETNVDASRSMRVISSLDTLSVRPRASTRAKSSRMATDEVFASSLGSTGAPPME